ncbi:hypothetical protein [Phenylobacterium sp.]|uniref:hypothetical protein n=1 Tax=Phenylobacterium sp. TaxID=1871053 RepID=UPI002DE4C021|nr:hypothetical protein [Phenylobacterium sp.]
MSKIDLSTLPAQELRQLLDSARNRGQAAQSYEILREMDARRARPAPAKAKAWRRSSRREPRLVELQLGDPLAAPDEVFLSPDDEPPLTLGHETAQPTLAAAAPAPARSRWGHWGALCFAMGLAGGVAAGWWAAGGGSWAPPQPALASAAHATPRRPLPVVVGSEPAIAAAPAVAGPVVAETQLASAAGPADASTTAAATASPPEPAPVAAESAPSRTAATEAHAVVPGSQERVAEAASASETACSGEPTPADTVICREPRLRRLQAELRRAYAEALAAHEDRGLLRQRQLAWRDGRNAVSSPDQLARLYLRRIEQLKAATAEAVRER